MKQIVDKLNIIAKAIDETVELPETNLITDSLDAITKALGGTPNDSNLIVDKLDDIAGVAEPKPTGNIELTENAENVDIAQYATATVNVSGGGVSYKKLSVHFVNDSGLAVPSTILPSILLEEDKLFLNGTPLNLDDGGTADLDFLYYVYEEDNTTYYVVNFGEIAQYVQSATDAVNCSWTSMGVIDITDGTLDASITLNMVGSR